MAIKNLKITTLVDNAVNSGGLLAEWGFSLFIETDQLNILFDCGATPTPFFYNSKSLGVDLATIDKIVISHGHNDHTGALDAILQAIPQKPDIVIGPYAWQSRFYEKEWAGITHNKAYIESLGSEIKVIYSPTELSDDILSIVHIPMACDFESIDSNLYTAEDGAVAQDNFTDEQALAISTEKGLVVITGCAHRGIVNIIEHAKKSSGCDQVYAVLGGSHLMNAQSPRIEKTIAYFKEQCVKKIALSHCTGDRAAVAFAHAFADEFIFNKAGVVVDFS